MRSIVAVVSAILPILMSTSAIAGRFAGFSSDRTVYVSGTDQICKPIPTISPPIATKVPTDKSAPSNATTTRAVPDCKTGTVQQIAKLRLRRPPQQTASTSQYQVASLGTLLTIRDRVSNALHVSWQSTDPIKRIHAIFVDAQTIAIEYETSFAGRITIQTVAFVLTALPKKVDAAVIPNLAPAGQALSPAAEKALRIARTWTQKRNHRRARKSYEAVLAIAPHSSEAIFGIARHAAAMGQKVVAIAALNQLAAQNTAQSIEWLIEARTNPAFRRIRGEPAFRKAVRLDVPTNRQTAYERLVGLGGKWEQSGVACEQADVSLHLKGRLHTFVMKIRSRCRGQSFTTKLKGSWQTSSQSQKAPSQLQLTFPNEKRESEQLLCQLSACPDQREDCLRCDIDRDLSVQLRPVRR